MRQAIKRAIVEKGGTIRLPVNQENRKRKIHRKVWAGRWTRTYSRGNRKRIEVDQRANPSDSSESSKEIEKFSPGPRT